MAWLATSKTLILKHQAYSIEASNITTYTLSKLIDEQMNYVLANLPDLVTAIEADLATLETLDTALTTEGGSTNSLLIQAAELKWSDTRSKTAGIQERYDSIRNRVARMLSQAISFESTGGNWGMGSLSRG